MCNFLKTYVGDVIFMTYKGRMLPGMVKMTSNEKRRIELSAGISFFGENVVSTIVSRHGGDRLSFQANIHFGLTSDSFPGKIGYCL